MLFLFVRRFYLEIYNLNKILFKKNELYIKSIYRILFSEIRILFSFVFLFIFIFFVQYDSLIIRHRQNNIDIPLYEKEKENIQYISFQNNGIKTGYNKFLVNNQIYHIFIPPIPSVYSYEPIYDWYKTQYNTGIPGNCGPACVAMAIYWSTGEDISVEEVRLKIGFPVLDGGINYEHMGNVLFPEIPMHEVYLHNFKDIKKIIDEGNIFIILFNTIWITFESNYKNIFFGRYYRENAGHYVIVKGYSEDQKYVIVYDPMPSSWNGNESRYSDNYTMIGKNRYYRVSELMYMWKRKYSMRVLVIGRKK